MPSSILLAPAGGNEGVDHGNQPGPVAVAGLGIAAPRQFAVQGGDELLDLVLHLAHLLPHVQDDLHTRQVHAEIARQVQDDFQPLDILRGVEARVALAS